VVSLVCIVHGDIYERYAADLLRDAQTNFLPGKSEIKQLPGRAGWPYGSASRYGVLLEHFDRLHGDHIFLIDADMRMPGMIGEEILCDGITVTTHPGVHPDSDPRGWPYERNPASSAYVEPGREGRQYFPGCFVGGTRAAFHELAVAIDAAVEDDFVRGVPAVWYEESHLNRRYIDHPPSLILDHRYCGWGLNSGGLLEHLNKTTEEFENRG
jgi:hypothetical protein